MANTCPGCRERDARTCPCCGHVTREAIPQEIKRQAIGERLGATLSYRSGCPHVRKRGVEEVVETVFGVPLSLGTVANREPVRQSMQEWLAEGAACADAKTARFCQNQLAVEPALWTFLSKRGVEPTTNHLEQLLRSGVLWRKRSFGCHRAAECRLVERILTVTQTLRLQKRPVMDYLVQALRAHRAGQPAPQLLPTG
jgi:hypothetical protein